MACFRSATSARRVELPSSPSASFSTGRARCGPRPGFRSYTPTYFSTLNKNFCKTCRYRKIVSKTVHAWIFPAGVTVSTLFFGPIPRSLYGSS